MLPITFSLQRRVLRARRASMRNSYLESPSTPVMEGPATAIPAIQQAHNTFHLARIIAPNASKCQPCACRQRANAPGLLTRPPGTRFPDAKRFPPPPRPMRARKTGETRFRRREAHGHSAAAPGADRGPEKPAPGASGRTRRARQRRRARLPSRCSPLDGG